MENMRSRRKTRMIVGKGPRRPKHRNSLERKHRIKQFTKRMKRQRSI